MAKHSDSIPTLLLVTESAYQKTYFKKVLKNSFFLITSHDSFSAVDWIKSMPIDAIILDQKTLHSTWAILCQHVRQLPGCKTTPILLITNNHKKSFFLEALNLGVSDFIHEPLDGDEIYQRIIVSLQTKPVNKKMVLITQKIKKQTRPSLPRKRLSLRFVTTEAAIKEISKVKKTHRPLSLIMLEIDDFQTLSESHPKSVIDSVLAGAEKFLQNQLRKFDVLMPQGGGRFLILLPKTSHRAAMMIAEMIRKEVPDAIFSPRKKEIELTFSLGVIAYDEKIPMPKNAYDQFEELLIKVDSALKEAKKQGNQIISC